MRHSPPSPFASYNLSSGVTGTCWDGEFLRASARERGPGDPDRVQAGQGGGLDGGTIKHILFPVRVMGKSVLKSCLALGLSLSGIRESFPGHVSGLFIFCDICSSLAPSSVPCGTRSPPAAPSSPGFVCCSGHPPSLPQLLHTGLRNS